MVDSVRREGRDGHNWVDGAWENGKSKGKKDHRDSLSLFQTAIHFQHNDDYNHHLISNSFPILGLTDSKLLPRKGRTFAQKFIKIECLFTKGFKVTKGLKKNDSELSRFLIRPWRRRRPGGWLFIWMAVLHYCKRRVIEFIDLISLVLDSLEGKSSSSQIPSAIPNSL